MKGQITRHEWGSSYGNSSPETEYIFCSVCNCKQKFEYGSSYFMPADKSDWQIKEPKCIPRKKNTR